MVSWKNGWDEREDPSNILEIDWDKPVSIGVFAVWIGPVLLLIISLCRFVSLSPQPIWTGVNQSNGSIQFIILPVLYNHKFGHKIYREVLELSGV